MSDQPVEPGPPSEGRPDAIKPKPVEVQAVLAEDTSLRSEVSSRSRDQLVCVTASLVSLDILLSTVATDPIRFSGLLVVAPWILAIFGIVWSDHAHAIHLIGRYIRDEIEKKTLPELFGDRDEIEREIRRIEQEIAQNGQPEAPFKTGKPYIRWETQLQYERETSWFLGWINTALPLLYFGIPAVGVMVTYVFLSLSGSTELPKGLEILFLMIGLLLLAVLGFSWDRARRLT